MPASKGSGGEPSGEIEADTKDWTWVLLRPCPECGFDASTCRAEAVAGLVRENAATWARLVAAGGIVAVRPDPSIWSPLEYACHVRDVYRRFDGRIERMISEHDPLFENWDQDASAVEGRYASQDPLTVVADLVVDAEAVAARLDTLSPLQWQRPGRRSDGASFTVASIARYMAHDTIHHIVDVTRPPG